MPSPPASPAPERGLLPRIFLSSDENRLRAGWRLLAHLILLGVCALLFGAVITLPLMLTGNMPPVDDLVLNQAIFMLSVTASTFIARRWIDRRAISSLGLRWDGSAARDLLVGVGIGGVIMAAIFLIEWGAGWLTLFGAAWQFRPPLEVMGSTLIMLAVFVLVGWNEELLVRGYWLQNMADGTNLTWGVLLSASIFALLHLGNPNVSAIAIVGLFLAGVFLAYGYVRTRQLWLSIGLHIGWNFFENTVFGFPVSGLDTPGLLVHNVAGPEWFTGGAFGPEAGLVAVLGMGLGAWLISLYTRGRIVRDAPVG